MNDYLKVFQMDEPMVSLLYEHLKSKLSSLLEKVVVPNLFDENFSVKAMMNIYLRGPPGLEHVFFIYGTILTKLIRHM